jgi:hypothetical protein
VRLGLHLGVSIIKLRRGKCTPWNLGIGWIEVWGTASTSILGIFADSCSCLASPKDREGGFVQIWERTSLERTLSVQRSISCVYDRWVSPELAR